jgi:hypothetical protein
MVTEEEREKFLQQMEKILGRKFERIDARSTPGTKSVAGREFIYFENIKGVDEKNQFTFLLDHEVDNTPLEGGALSDDFTITIPDGTRFHAMSYRLDLDGWRRKIQGAATNLGILLAHIENNRFVLSDGRSFPLDDCETDYPEKPNKKASS